MPSIVVVGAHWGDEGKGKIVDMLAQSADMVVRYSGGDNAGHTVINDQGKFGLHLVPSGIFCKQAVCVIANGTVINPESLLSELDMLQSKGVDCSRLCISDKAHLTLPYHVLLDGAEETARGSAAIGTTKRGIGPTYADKAARNGLRMGDLLDLEAAAGRLKATYASKEAALKRLGLELIPFDALMAKLGAYAKRIGPLITATETLINQALDDAKTVVFEGAQGTLLDVEFGTYPYVTSSTTIAPGVYPGAGLRPRALDHILGVFKAYTTRVGTGPMPTELLDETGELIRTRAHEFGVTTGRPRRCGWFDAVAGRYSVQINGMNAGALTRLDVLDDFPSIKVCVAYEINGKPVRDFPGSLTTLNRCKPVYEELPGWRKPTPHLRRFEDLPAQAKAYVHRLEHLVGCPMKMISVGPRREETITVAALV
ncbi:MAG: adenylosuccinate synthase [Dehalococcoidia bacterium]|nr:adenylosuccinate synthase [Dehalococcoidia bacterium]